MSDITGKQAKDLMDQLADAIGSQDNPAAAPPIPVIRMPFKCKGHSGDLKPCRSWCGYAACSDIGAVGVAFSIEQRIALAAVGVALDNPCTENGLRDALEMVRDAFPRASIGMQDNGPSTGESPQSSPGSLGRAHQIATPSASSSRYPDQCWLIETGSPAKYFTVHEDPDMDPWTEEAHRAIRFPNRAAAEMTIRNFCLRSTYSVSILPVEHIFGCGPLLADAQPSSIGPRVCVAKSQPPMQTGPGEGEWYCGGCGASNLEPRCKVRKGCPDELRQGERESVDDVLELVESYGPWGTDINESFRNQIVLAEEVKRLRGLLAETRPYLDLLGEPVMVVTQCDAEALAKRIDSNGAPRSTGRAPEARWANGVCKTCGNAEMQCRCEHPGREAFRALFTAPQEGASSTAGPASNGEPAVAVTDNLPSLLGVSRMFDNGKALLVSFERSVTDDELRFLHELLAGRIRVSSASVAREPTAWRYRYGSGAWKYVESRTDVNPGDGYEVQALFSEK